MTCTESAMWIACAGEQLLGILATPAHPRDIGVLVLVGGPQYRVGSHRQFLLLSRALANAGYACLRFDFRGMGDSGGAQSGFEEVTPDIAAAIDRFLAECPAVKRVVLWGLCDAASAALLYMHSTRDTRIAGLCLLNPWVRSESTLARTQVKHYYSRRLFEAQFWMKMARGEVGIFKAIAGLFSAVNAAAAGKEALSTNQPQAFQQRMAEAMREFQGSVLLILSERDYTAKEFLEMTKADAGWAALFARQSLTRVDVASADHTFSSAQWRNLVEQVTRQWLSELELMP